MTRLGALTSSLCFSVALFVATGAAAAAEKASPAPDPRVGAPGPDCIDLIRIDHTEILDDNTILFHMKGKTTYISKLPYRCHGLKFEDGFAYTSSINKICGNLDVIKVLRRGNSCALGPFHTYIKPAKETKPDDAKSDPDPKPQAD